jgi:hypothetical protein
MNQTCCCQIALAFCRLLCQDVTFERMLSFDFTASSDRESLLCTGFSFHFWHLSSFLSYLYIASFKVVSTIATLTLANYRSYASLISFSG